MAIRAAQPSTPSEAAGTGVGADHSKAPWHFKVLLVALVIYLGFRLVQLLIMVAHWL